MYYSPLRLALGGLGLVTSSALATNLYVSSYSGDITSLRLSQSDNGSYALAVVATNRGSAPSPAWLEKEPGKGVVYCMDEGLPVPNGSISSYRTSPCGELTLIDRHTTISGPVSSVVYNKGKAMAAAHYGGSAVTTWNILPTGGLSPLQNFTFKLSAPGTNPGRQDAPHPHEAIVDPTDSFIIVPDLGADLLRVFSIDPATSALTPSKSFSTPPGSGPRHGAFSVSGCADIKNQECLASKADTYFFVVSEISNNVTSYKVTYGNKTLDFTEVFTTGIYGNQTTPVGAAAGEALISPDNKFLLTSSRNATLFSIPNFDSTNSTKIPSDTLQSWSIDHTTGKLSFRQSAPAGGSFPRQFSVNQKGTLVAVGLQLSSRVVIMERNPSDGTFGKFVAEVGVTGDVTSVIWDE
ncbi:Uncharacterized protein BP5553_04274 [Venustampulla echinocandica]|uniref:Isomerase YbhE n=1 Tax=Venustampulla echinocandica TaxID=2656787 RepID=A0A370TWM8_9HELO|nr:Uncharacterized protein BP5553_04274 [Venustampulla echinocandica]RDL39934.1 Uncharacterized protein BP5553_04274 [Venustampulla echinocandica]